MVKKEAVMPTQWSCKDFALNTTYSPVYLSSRKMNLTPGELAGWLGDTEHDLRSRRHLNCSKWEIKSWSKGTAKYQRKKKNNKEQAKIVWDWFKQEIRRWLLAVKRMLC